jgi:16S rRNA G1207 methylase RsmC
MGEHYFSAAPGTPERRQPVDLVVWGHELRLESASGVFAAGRLDIGTAVLLRQSRPSPGARRLLDLGCGYGAIACGLASELPDAHVWAVDVNERALRLTRDNAARLGVADRLHVAQPGDVPTDLEFDEIWSNPPIRVGKEALHELLSTWLPRLAPDGRAVLVVGKNLGADSLQRWVAGQGYACARLGSAKGFRVLEVRRRPS